MAQVSFSGKRELRWLQEGDCFITFVEADVAIADALWDQWLAAFVAAPGKKRLLASWGDIQPTKDQWRRATRMMRDAKTKVAMVTESRPTSALIKAASWAGLDSQAFRWEQLYEASVWLDFDSAQRLPVRTSVTALRDCFGPVDGSSPVARSIANPVASARPSATPSPSARPVASARPTSTPSPSARPAAVPSAGARPAAVPSSSARQASTAIPSARPAASPPSRSAATPSAPTRPAATPSAPTRPVATPSTPSRPAARPPEPQRVVPTRSSATATTASKTPMADAASKNLAHVRQTSEEIQAKLAEIQARLRNRKRA